MKIEYKQPKKPNYRSLSKKQLINLVKQLTSENQQLEESLHYTDQYVDAQEKR